VGKNDEKNGTHQWKQHDAGKRLIFLKQPVTFYQLYCFSIVGHQQTKNKSLGVYCQNLVPSHYALECRLAENVTGHP